MNNMSTNSIGKESSWLIRGQVLNFRKPIIMGILNVTPDSFSDGGKYRELESALSQVHQMIQDGADIIDVGGESTRPGSPRVSPGEELDRVLPVIEGIAASSDVIVSIDTQKSEVAKAAIKAGAHIINDISAGRFDTAMFQVVSDDETGYVMMHMLGDPQIMQNNPAYDDVINDINTFFDEQIGKAEAAGVQRAQIVLDPGIGFGKTLEDNLTILANMKEFCGHGLPLILGASRKSFIGMLDQSTVEDRLGGSLAAVVSSYLHGVQIFRVHDVKETRQTLDIFTAIQKHLD